MSKEPKNPEGLTPYERDVHEALDLGPFNWRHALGCLLLAALLAVYWLWRHR